MPTRKLTPKQQRFCAEYPIDCNATRAAKAAGYSEKTAHVIGTENLKKPEIRDEIEQKVKKRAEKVEITAEYVLNNIKMIGERCLQAEPVLDKLGHPIGEWQFKEQGALKAQELLGKYLNIFAEKEKGNTYIYADLRKTIGDAAPERMRSFAANLRERIGSERPVIAD